MGTKKNRFLKERYSSAWTRKLMILCAALVLQGGLISSVVVADSLSSYQDGRISGVVKDVNGEPLIGVSVSVKGTTTGTVTDLDGKYSIAASQGSELSFTYLGMQSQVVKVGNQSSFDVVMREDAAVMDEVVVIGYGTVKRSNLSGAVSTASSKDLQRLPAANISQALQGNIPGLRTVQGDRSPGAEVTMQLRGTNSLQGAEPLFIVDGFPIASTGGISAINPSDIESVSVLKDASSTAIYGARAANGVILITTKMGKVGKPVLEVNTFWGMKHFSNPIDLMNAQQFAELRRESYKMDGRDMPSNAFLDPELDMLEKGQSTNWFDEITNQNALTQSYQVSFSSGTETTRVHLGVGLYDEQGIVNNSGFTRGNLRFNIAQKFGDRVTLTSNTSLSLMSTRGTNATNVLFPALVGNPIAPIKDDSGEYYPMIVSGVGTPRANPVAFSELPKNKIMQPVMNTSFALEVKLIDGLRFKTQLSGEIETYRRNFYNPKLISGQDETNDRITGGYASIKSDVNYNWISETTLMYNKTFNEIHNIDAVAGFSAQENRYESVTASASGFASDLYETNNLGASSGDVRKPASNLIEWSMLSYLGRIVYTLNDRYILTANMRVDGSSRFGVDNKYGYFPSGAVAWRMSEENFMQGIDWLSDLKIRASYGLAGNANVIPPYSKLAELAYANYNFGGQEVPGYYESKLFSTDLKWETTKQLDLGLDVSLFNNRLSLTFDYYSKKTVDLLREVETPTTMGFNKKWMNMGSMQNKGFEIGINSVNFIGDFNWRTNFIIASNRNKMTSFGDGSDRMGITHILGEPSFIGNRFMLEAIGIWQENEKDEAAKYGAIPGDVKYRDLDGDYQINNEDRKYIGSIQPNFYGSMTNSFAYKNFDLDIFMTFSEGMDIYNGNNFVLLSGAGADNNRIEMLKRWTPENPSNKYPRASASGSNRQSAKSSEFLEDASYLKIKNITLGYSVPSRLISKLGMSYLRIYGSVTNPFTFTSYTGMDPEDGDILNNSRTSVYPITTTYLLGLQLKF